LMSQIVISSLHGGRRKLPWVFTEHGAIMAATILNSKRAVAMSGAKPFAPRASESQGSRRH